MNHFRRSSNVWLFTALLLQSSAWSADSVPPRPEEPVDLFVFIGDGPVETMPQYRSIWSATVNEEAIRQPAGSIRLNGPGMSEIVVPIQFWSPRAGYIQIYNKEDPNLPITVPDPNARPEDFSWHWYGQSGHTVVSLNVERGTLAGRIWQRNKRFALRPSPDGLLLGETNSSYWRLHPDPGQFATGFMAGDEEFQMHLPPLGGTAGGWDYSCSGSLPNGHHVVDVLVLYTQGVLNAYGSHAGVDAKVRLGLVDANVALRKSGILSFSYYLTGVEFLPNSSVYDSSPITEGLAAFSGAQPVGFPPYCQLSDNSYVLSRRNSLNADIVALARRDSSSQGTCGYTFIQRKETQFCSYEPGPAFERFAYMIFDPECNADRLNFAHELGHQLGADHDPRNYSISTGSMASCPWSYAHRSDDPTLGFRTVMAYPTEGNTALPGPECESDAECPLIDAFSTPLMEWTGIAVQPIPAPPQGLPIGIAVPPPTNWQPSFVVDTLQRVAPVSADFRQRPDLVFADGFE